LRGDLEKLATAFSNFHTLVGREGAPGYPHALNWNNWVKRAAPGANLVNVAGPVGELRQIKSPGEIALLTKAIELSIDAHFEAMRMMRPGVHEYEVAARMEYVHKRGGSEVEGYAPIVGSGFYSTVLHYNEVGKRIEDGEVIVLDVGASYSGYSADITRTLPASGKFTPRQREIYEIVLGAQNAVLAALKPGMTMGGDGPNSLGRIAREYINSHGKDMNGQPLGQYFIHGLGHHIGLNVHDPGPPRPLEPGMVITIEPGIYIPEEKLGVRIEDDVLITETGYKLLTARLPRTIEEIEKVMAEARKRPVRTDD
jgi:Xaa-Pro aminopeptidase